MEMSLCGAYSDGPGLSREKADRCGEVSTDAGGFLNAKCGRESVEIGPLGEDAGMLGRTLGSCWRRAPR